MTAFLLGLLLGAGSFPFLARWSRVVHEGMRKQAAESTADRRAAELTIHCDDEDCVATLPTGAPPDTRRSVSP